MGSFSVDALCSKNTDSIVFTRFRDGRALTAAREPARAEMFTRLGLCVGG